MSNYRDIFIGLYNNRLYESIQQHTSAKTSIKQISAGIKHAVKSGLIKPNSVAVDNGGGKYDLAKDHVESNISGAKLHVHDPFNRSESHNNQVKHETTGKADYVGMHNVLNVIKEPEHRHAALQQVKSFLKPKTGVAHLTVYEGDKKGIGRVSQNDTGEGSSWQNHMKTNEYLPDVHRVFPPETHDVKSSGGHIIIRQK